MRLILTAHGSADPRAAETTHGVAHQIRALRPELAVEVAFCEKSTPNLADVLADRRGPAVVAPLLLASAYHARVDIPAMIAESDADAVQADVLGEDPRLVEVLHRRVVETGASPQSTGVLIVAVGSSHEEANARTATLAAALPGDWAAVHVAFATGPKPDVAEGIAGLRAIGVDQIVVAPWFIAPGRITDRVAATVTAEDAVMADPLGAHPLLAATVLDRFDTAIARRLVA